MVHGDIKSQTQLRRLSTHTLVVQWLRLHTPNAGGLGLIPGWGTVNRSCMLQLRPSTAPAPANKTQQYKGCGLA